MSEIKPVYQRYCNDEKWLDINKARYVEEIEADCAETRIIYPAAAYEALKEENEALHKNHDLLQAKVDCLYDQIELEKSKTRGEEETVKRVVTYSEALQKENAELKAEDEISVAVIEKCCNLLAQIAVTLKGEPEELTRHGYHDLPDLVSVLHVENELNKQSISKFEQILEGVPEGAFDGGWTARGIMKHASDLEKANAAQAKRIAELEETNGLLQTQVHCLEMTLASRNGE